MKEFVYTPDEEIKVHSEGAIRLLCGDFQSHEAGLPEWVKNSSDAYARENTPSNRRAIVLLFDHNRRNSPPSISCLDFCGMTVRTIEQDFRHWASPDAARGENENASVQGGHGNGGKCYMVQMFKEYSIIHTARDGRANRYGVPYKGQQFGYIPSPEEARNYPVPDLKSELERALGEINTTISSLPDVISPIVESAKGFSLVTGFGPSGYDKKIPVQVLLQTLRDHPQMIRSLELCDIYVVINGKPYEGGAPLKLQTIPPLPGTEEPREVKVPDSLEDPSSGESVETSADPSSEGYLRLYTSKVSMRWKKKYRHNILYKTEKSGVVGYIPVTDLDVQSPYRDNIYGEIELSSLEELKQNSRRALADSPLTRALNVWISGEVQKYAKEFEATDRRKYAHEERDAVSKMNEALDRWKNRFLNEMAAGFWGDDGGGTHRASSRLPSGKVVRLELSLSHNIAGVGVALRPNLRFYDSTGKQVRSVPFKWVSDDTNVAWVDEQVGVINTFAKGTTQIWAETLEGNVESNKETLEVASIQEIRLFPTELELFAGSRTKVEAECILAEGEVKKGVYLVWTEGDSGVARVSSSGLVYGFGVGRTQITAGDDKVIANPVEVNVIEGDGKGKGGKGGRGYPLILVSGPFDKDPETGDEIVFSSEAPPVAQRPQDVNRNIWWINSAAPLADLYLSKTTGYGYETREWRMYHLERVMEVILQIAMTYGFEDRSQEISFDEWIIEWGNKASEIQAAVVSDLSNFISDGEIPEE